MGTSLIEAIKARDADAARRTLAVNAYAADGFTPVGLAAYFQRKEVVELLLARGAGPNLASRNVMQVRPLHSAVAGGPDVEIARLLLDAGADVDARQRRGFTALHGAAQTGVLPQVELLLARGAEVDTATDDGNTPLRCAEEGHHEAVAALLRRAARR